MPMHQPTVDWPRLRPAAGVRYARKNRLGAWVPPNSPSYNSSSLSVTVAAPASAFSLSSRLTPPAEVRIPPFTLVTLFYFILFFFDSPSGKASLNRLTVHLPPETQDTPNLPTHLPLFSLLPLFSNCPVAVRSCTQCCSPILSPQHLSSTTAPSTRHIYRRPRPRPTTRQRRPSTTPLQISRQNKEREFLCT